MMMKEKKKVTFQSEKPKLFYYSFRISNYDPHNCEICNISCNSKIIYENHLNGKRHQKILEKFKESEYKCDICNKKCGSDEGWKSHLLTRDHILEYQKTTMQHLLSTNSDATQTPSMNDALKCKQCDLHFDSNVILQSHLTGLKHRRKVKFLTLQQQKQQKDPDVYCEVCDLVLPDTGLMEGHYAGARHKRSLQQQQQQVAQTDDTRLSSGAVKMFTNRSLEWCPVCDVALASKTEAMAHYDSAEHFNKAAVTSLHWCNVCKVRTQTAVILEQHLRGFKHYLILNRDNKDPREHPFREKLLSHRRVSAEIRSQIRKRKQRPMEHQ